MLDNARYNHSREIQAYFAREGCRVVPVYLPSYAPNLNLIERIWGLFKKMTLYNHYFPTFAEFKAAVDGFFNNLERYRDEINSLITGAFHFIGQPKAQPP